VYVRLADGLSAAGLTVRDRQRGDWRPLGGTGRLDWLGGTGGTGETGGRRAVRARTTKQKRRISGVSACNNNNEGITICKAYCMFTDCLTK
jgi:hypothetical protein